MSAVYPNGTDSGFTGQNFLCFKFSETIVFSLIFVLAVAFSGYKILYRPAMFGPSIGPNGLTGEIVLARCTDSRDLIKNQRSAPTGNE